MWQHVLCTAVVAAAAAALAFVFGSCWMLEAQGTYSWTAALAPGAPLPAPSPPLATLTGGVPMRFGIVGDQGIAGPGQAGVAAMVRSWGPLDSVMTLGDNNYESGAWETIEDNVGQYWRWTMSDEPDKNRFWPCIGNHDWGNRPYGNCSTHLRYFTALQGRRYYDVVFTATGSTGGGTGGDALPLPLVHWFVMSSDRNEDRYDGTRADSVQGQWLRAQLAASRAVWKIVVVHHPPYSSGRSHASEPWMRWPYEEWGADVLLAGHQHSYERVHHGSCNFTYIVNGIGGAELAGFWWLPFMRVQGSAFKYERTFGAQLLTATPSSLTFEFHTSEPGYPLRDCFRLDKGGAEGGGGCSALPSMCSAEDLAEKPQ